jgi:hypothetical protein
VIPLAGLSVHHTPGTGADKINLMRYQKQALMPAFGLAILILLSVLFAASGRADEDAPYPSFVASYDANANGLGIGTVQVSLTRIGSNEYLYEQKSVTRGIAALFGSDNATQSSRWRFHDNAIQVIEYQSQRKKGDDDDNAHLVFDWENRRVKNIGAGEQWDIALPEGAIDRLVMQLAMLLDLRKGDTVFKYQIPRQGRVKNYHFELVGEESIELDSGTYRTLKAERTDDDRDRSWVWSAPELDYFPVRFLKHKKSGIKLELVLKKLEFSRHEPGAGKASSR